MFLTLLKYGINTTLKTVCKKITLIETKIRLKEKDKLNSINKIYITAKNIIFKNIYINKVNIKISNFDIDLSSNNTLFPLDKFNVDAIITINENNIRNIIFNKNFMKIKSLIEQSLLENNSIIDINITYNKIFFAYFKEYKNCKLSYEIKLYNDNIWLINYQYKREIFLPLDQNIILKDINFFDKYFKIKISSKVKL